MKLKRVKIKNYSAIERLELRLDPSLMVFHGDNAHGKTSILSAIAAGLGSIPWLLPDVSSIGFIKADRRQRQSLQVKLTTANGFAWRRTIGPRRRRTALRALKEAVGALATRTDFKDLFGGGYVKEYEELRRQKERHEFDFQNAVGGPAKFLYH